MSRAAEIGDDDLVVEAVGGDTLWRKHTSGVTAHAEAGGAYIDAGEDDDSVTIDVSHVEILPNGADRGVVTIDTNLQGKYRGSEWEQGTLHELTPRQARSFAAALLEQAEFVEGLEG